MPIGLYIHAPFCVGKCPYCDFYSLRGDEERMDAYTERVLAVLDEWAQHTKTSADTLYFGGGTPSLLGARRLTTLIERAAYRFGLTDAEITLEANPGDQLDDTLTAFAQAGGNRLSLGMQSADAEELRQLGRRHRPDDVLCAVEVARRAGIGNLSLDLMLGISGQTAESVRRSAAVCRELGVDHVSAYLLKIEPHTPYASRTDLNLPDEDETTALYHIAAETLEAAGFLQYEISNFSRPGRESRHNTKYWNLDEYIGIGPSAHSYIDGKRLAYARDLDAFLQGNAPAPEAETEPWLGEGSPEEYLMLRLRLTEGLTEQGFSARFGTPIPQHWRQAAKTLPSALIVCDDRGIRLTRAGFLLSNAILVHLLS